MKRIVFVPSASRKPRRAPKKERRGVALIMVLVLTTILGAIAADLSNASQVNLRAASNARDQLQAHFHARSALELELFVLRFQAMLKGTLEQFVPIPLFELSGYLVSSDTVKGILRRDGHLPEEGTVKGTFAIDKPFGDFHGSFWIEEVVDENRKININKESLTMCSNLSHLLMKAVMEDPKYDPLFESMGDSRDPLRNRIELVANVTDWVDGNESVDNVCTITGDQAQSSISEDTRYNNLPYRANYKPKNGQMLSMAEMRMIPHVNDAFMRLFSKYFTVWSDNAGISMNTADAWMLRAVIRAISPGPPLPADQEKIEKFLEGRELMRAMPPPMNKLSKPLFMQLLTEAQIQYDPAVLQQLEQAQMLRFDDVSSVYRITAMGRVNNALSTITVVWRDNRAQGEIFYWRED